jgi:hypothetical protein
MSLYGEGLSDYLFFKGVNPFDNAVFNNTDPLNKVSVDKKYRRQEALLFSSALSKAKTSLSVRLKYGELP